MIIRSTEHRKYGYTLDICDLYGLLPEPILQH
jgi:hypothetical protein